MGSKIVVMNNGYDGVWGEGVSPQALGLPAILSNFGFVWCRSKSGLSEDIGKPETVKTSASVTPRGLPKRTNAGDGNPWFCSGTVL